MKLDRNLIGEKVLKKHKFGITAFGEVLIDFTDMGKNNNGQKLFAQNPGGAPANVLAAASNLGSETAFVGKAGQDMHGAFLKEVLRDTGINVDGFLLDENYFTTLAFVELNDKGERSFSFARKPGADTMMLESEMNMEVILNSNIYHVGSLSLTNEPSRSATYQSLEKAREEGVIISYDPNYRARLWENEEAAKAEMRNIIPDIMKISDEETTLLTDCSSPEGAAQALLDKGVKIVVVTLGSEGAYVLTKEGGQIVKGYKSNVVDTTGAGDAFWGGFLHKVNESQKRPEDITLEDASTFVQYANAVASLCVEGSGAIPAMPDEAAAVSRMLKYI